MVEVAAVARWLAPFIAGVVLVVGVYAVAVIDAAVAAKVADQRARFTMLVAPSHRAALGVVQQPASTERPDAVLRTLAPAALVGLASAGLAVVPLTSSVAIADVPAGIVWWGAVESLAILAVFLHGWSPNSVQPLVGGYRYVAGGLSALLLSMFVLIAVAVSAQSLRVGAIVADQHDLWNVVRQPLGLPLFSVVALAITSSNPLNLANVVELAGGTAAEESGVPQLVWSAGQAALLVSFAVMGAAAFLGGWLGPALPGAVWMTIKSAALLILFVVLGHLVARVRAERFVTLCWTVLLPLAFLDLAIAGVESLR